MIYFIQDSGSLYIKIGYTEGSADDRAAALQTGNPSRLVVLMTIEGGKPAEAALHAMFCRHRVSGEWFRPHPDILCYMLRSGGTADLLRRAGAWLAERSRRDDFLHPDGELDALALAAGVDRRALDFARQLLLADVALYEIGYDLWWGNRPRPAAGDEGGGPG